MESLGNILVIDDEIGICRGCQRALEPQGFLIKTARTIEDGYRQIKEGYFDLVLLDVMLPDGRGIDLLERIKELDPEIVCVIITGFATVELAVKAVKLGAYDFIAKPFTSDQLLMTVNQGLEKRHLALEAKRLQAIERRATELAQEKEEMERLDRFKSTFMLTVAHELRSPVGGSLSLLRTLIRGLAGELTDQQNEILKRIEKRLTLLLELINDLLSLASNKAIEPDEPLESVDLQMVVNEVIDHFSIQSIEKNQTITFEAPDKTLTVIATRDGLATVFNNLVSNAIKYTPNGGNILIKAQLLSDEAQITVSDTGIGIPPEDLPHLGEEFFRAQTAREFDIDGTGLGLSIVNQLMQRFEGKIDIQSTVGAGTSFTIKLKLANTQLQIK